MTTTHPLTLAVGLLATGVLATGSWTVVHPPPSPVRIAATGLQPPPWPPYQAPTPTPTSIALATTTVTTASGYSRTSSATPAV